MNLSEGAVKAAETLLESLEYDFKMAAIILRGDNPGVNKLPITWRGNTVRSAAAARMWRQEGRQTLAIHPEVVRECSLASSSEFPSDVLRAIPYINPMVVYAEPIVIPTWRGKGPHPNEHLMVYEKEKESALRLVGFICYGLSDYENWSLAEPPIASTHDPLAERLGVTAVCEVLDKRGNRLDFDSTSISIRFGINGTIESFVEEQLHKFAFAGSTGEKSAREYMSLVYRHILGSLMYLASTTLDAEKVPASATAKLAKRTIARKPLSFYRIGWTVGANLSKLRQERPDTNPSQMGDIRHQQDPQHRRAHFKVAWCGPGRSIPKTVFVAPYWTHRERLGLRGINTVRPVKKTG